MSEHSNAAERGRWAVAATFLVSGFVAGSWAPQIPVALTRLSITESTLGLLILCVGIGAVVAMPWSGLLMSRYGTRAVLRATAVASSLNLFAVALAPSVWLVGVMLCLFGAVAGSLDVAMNANAAVVEQKLRRPIMSSSHGFWSLGGFAGGGLGGAVIQVLGYLTHAALASAVALAVLAWALPRLVVEERPLAHQRARIALPRSPAIYLVGLLGLFASIPEGAVFDWAAVYLKQELGTDLATAGFAFGAFSGAMAAMRFLGDGVRNRLGAVLTFRISGVLAAAGMLVAGLSPWPWLAIVAFAACGLGIANMVPIAYSAGGNQPGMQSGTGMAVVSTMGYSGLLLAPSAIGFAAERTGFGPVFVALAGMLVVACLMAPLASAADVVAPQPAQ